MTNLTLSELPLIKAETTVGVNAYNARAWFLSLEKHPERYQFATHAGFTFTHGNFGQIGARFETREIFYGLKIPLHFELIDVGTSRFQFRLRRLPVWGAFTIEEQTSNTAKLKLLVGADSKAGRILLRLPLVEKAVQQQIQGEVDNIRVSMENICGGASRPKSEA